MLGAIGTKDNYKLLASTVCSIKNQCCINSSCNKCPGNVELCEYLRSDEKVSFDRIDIISLKQWALGNCTTSVMLTVLPEGFMHRLFREFDAFEPHHIIFNEQVCFLLDLETKEPGSCSNETTVLLFKIPQSHSTGMKPKPQFI